MVLRKFGHTFGFIISVICFEKFALDSPQASALSLILLSLIILSVLPQQIVVWEAISLIKQYYPETLRQKPMKKLYEDLKFPQLLIIIDLSVYIYFYTQFLRSS